ncbi:formimidoylglutamase [Winogradskyella aurantiaca]|uniref:formimidoylglutamase n=1 Tax=Winogradskyella aurantiaca TaxID=2219558 RepID=UPI000E1D70F8|nr:formimidoylglutamase [Winogradskyella aurantiaca]
MNFNFLSPVSDEVLAHTELLSNQALGKKIEIHSQQNGLPELDNIELAIIGVAENRNDEDYMGEELNFAGIRHALYSLLEGSWHAKIADLGDLLPGDSIDDTYYALQTCLSVLIEKNITPIIIGGSQDLTYVNYRAYDELRPMINIVSVDAKFDLGDAALPIKNSSYIGKVIVEEPYNLFNYATLGYQTYFNSQEEIDLMDRLYFEPYRLGEIVSNISLAEPVLRDANIVSVDLRSIRASEFEGRQKYSPNGFNGRDICAITRYAGISNKVSSFGVYEYKTGNKGDINDMLIAQMIWYFIEGFNARVNDDDFQNDSAFQKYRVLIENDELIFYKSLKTNRWWIEIPFLPDVSNKLKKHTLLPCSYEDYVRATQDEIPERWFKAYRKNIV